MDANVKAALLKQITALEAVQTKAMEDGDMDKVEKLATAIISVSNQLAAN